MIGSVLIAVLLTAAAAAADTVTAKAIHQAMDRFVRSELEGEMEEGERVEVNTRWQHDIELEAKGAAEVQLRRLSSRPLRGPTVLRATVLLDGKIQREMSVTADIRFFRPVLVASRSVRRGENLTAGMFEVAERDITSLKNGFYADVDELDNLRARRTVAVKNVLTHKHVEKVPVVQKGEQVVLVAQMENLRISTVGIALQDGGVGVRIRVRNQDSGKVIYGEVLDQQTVKVGM